MTLLRACQFIGAYRACSGILDAVTLLHSTTGCQWGTIALGKTSRLVDIRQGCTVIYDQDTIFGGMASLEEALEEVNKAYDPPLIIVIGGCVPAITADDLPSVADPNGRPRVVTIDAPGFGGHMPSGYDQALVKMADLMAPLAEKRPGSVNLIGFYHDDPKGEADLESIRSLLGDIQVNAVISACSYQEWVEAPRAELNVVCGRGKPLARIMAERFQLPYIQVEYPYGMEGSRRWAEAVASALNRDISEDMNRREQAVIQDLKKIYLYLHQLRGLPVAVVGDSVRAGALARFLRDELLFDVTFIDLDAGGLREDFEAAVRQAMPILLFGSSFEKDLADQLDIPLIHINYPVFDRVLVACRPYAGFQGLMHLAEDIINACMAKNI